VSTRKIKDLSVLTAVLLNIQVFCNVAPFQLVNIILSLKTGYTKYQQGERGVINHFDITFLQSFNVTILMVQERKR